jgi:hypothetical protein
MLGRRDIATVPGTRIMRSLLVAAAALAILLAASLPAAAAQTLIFQIDLTASTDPEFDPVSFQQTWTLFPDGSATASDPAFLTTMKAIEGAPADAYSERFFDSLGHTHNHGYIFALDGPNTPFPFFLTLTTHDPNQHLFTQTLGPGFAAYVGSASLDVVLGGPGPTRIGPEHEAHRFTERFYNGTARLIAAPVPEPQDWTLMILGFGLSSAALRTRHRQVTLR